MNTTVPVLRRVSIEYEVMVVSGNDEEAEFLAAKAVENGEAGEPDLATNTIVSREDEIPRSWKGSIPFGDIPEEWGIGPDPKCIQIFDRLKELKIVQYHDPNQMRLPGFEKIKP